MSQAFDRTLNSQQFLISQLENERQRKLQQSYQEEQQEKAKDEALKNQLIATGVGVAGGALTGGLLAAAAPAAGGLGAAAGAAGAGGAGATAGTAAGAGAAALGAPALASGVSGATLGSAVGAGAGTGLSVGGGAALGGLIGGLSTLPGGQVPAQLIGQSTPLFNPQIGINNQRLALDSARLANDTLATNSLIQSRRDNSNYQRDKLEQDATQFATTNQRLLDTQKQNLAFKYQDLGATNDRFLLGETGKYSRQQQGFENSLSLEGVRQENRLGLEDARQGNRFDLADINNRADTTRALLLQDRIDERAQTSQSNSLNRPAIRGQQAGQALMGTLSNNAYRNGDGTFNQAGIDLAMSSLLDGDFGPELPSVLNALGQRGFPVSAFLEQKKRRDPSFNFNFGGLPDN